MACLTPMSIRNPSVKTNTDFRFLVVPCGKCPECIRVRISSWQFRLVQEEKVHFTARFVTLTYDPDNVPVSPNGFMTLCKRDVQLFFKRLRFNTKRKSIKYYLCGEYGSKTSRPHYHAIIFDATESEIHDAWQNGHVHTDAVTDASITYTIKYMAKGRIIPQFKADDRVEEFSLMSKKLGANYMTPEMVKWHKDGLRNYVVKPGGYKSVMPRYYREKVFNEGEQFILTAEAQQKYEVDLAARISEYTNEQEYYADRYNRIRHYLKIKRAEEAQKRDKI